jgi:hypothetical protein
MVPVLRAMAAALVAAPGMDTATPRAHMDLVMSGLQPHLEAEADPGAWLRVLNAGYSSTTSADAADFLTASAAVRAFGCDAKLSQWSSRSSGPVGRTLATAGAILLPRRRLSERPATPSSASDAARSLALRELPC